MPRLKIRQKKILKSYRFDQELVEAIESKVNGSEKPVTETEIVVKFLKRGLGIK